MARTRFWSAHSWPHGGNRHAVVAEIEGLAGLVLLNIDSCMCTDVGCQIHLQMYSRFAHTALVHKSFDVQVVNICTMSCEHVGSTGACGSSSLLSTRKSSFIIAAHPAKQAALGRLLQSCWVLIGIGKRIMSGFWFVAPENMHM